VESYRFVVFYVFIRYDTDVGREGIIYEQVADAAESLLAQGERPTQLAVRARLGTGSLNTIQRHLSQWRAAQPPAAPSGAPLPAVIARAFQDELARAVAEARQELEQRVSLAEQEAVELARDGEAMQAELDAVRAELQAIMSERDALRVQVTDQAAQLDHTARDLIREHAAAEGARVQAAELQLSNEELRSRLADRTQELEALRKEVREGHQARIGLERELGAQRATNAGLLERLEERTLREQALTVELATREQTLASELAKVRERIDLLSERDRASATELAQRSGELKACQQLGHELRAQLDACTTRERDLTRELSRTQADLEAAQKAHESELERAQLQWQLEQRGKK
jgi:chromosome segregation ATPase